MPLCEKLTSDSKAKHLLLVKLMTEVSICFCTYFENICVYSKWILFLFLTSFIILTCISFY